MTDTTGEAAGPGSAGPLVPVQPLTTALDPYRPVGSYLAGGPSPESDWRADLLEYVRIFLKHKWLILGSVLCFVAVGGARTLMETPQYTATVRLQIDREAAKVVESGDVSATQNADADFFRTQFELLRSRSMAERVASIVHLGDDAAFLKPRDFSWVSALRNRLWPKQNESITIDKVGTERQAAEIVVNNIQVRPLAGSRLVDLAYSDPSPDRAQRIANAYAEAFAASNVDKRFQANSYAKTFLEDQLAQLKIKLEASEQALLAFAQREQIVILSEKSSIVEANLATANSAVSQVIAERIKNEQLWRQVEASNAIDLPQLLSNGVIDGLRAKRNALATEYREKLETFKPSYPDMQQISSKLAEIDRQLATEVKTIKSSFKAAYQSAQQQETELTARLATLKSEALDLQNRMIKYDILKREVETNRSLYNGLLQRYKQVDVASGVGANNVFVIDKAVTPGAPSSPQMSRALMLSLALGLGFGLLAAFGIERLDDRIRMPEEVERISGLPTLGLIPNVSLKMGVDNELADPRSALSEAYRSLCTALQFSTESGLPKTLVITSSSPSEGKSVTAVAIAKHFATMGLKVLLVDADLRNPSLHKKLEQDNSVGLSNYLTGACNPPETFQATTVPTLAFMSSGPIPPNAADLLAGKRFFSLLSSGLDVFDFIVIDGPPVMGLADAQLLSNAAAATVFVVGAGQARSGVVRGALKRLQLARSPVIGVVMTKFDARSAGYGYGYGYGYGDSYAYGQSPSGPALIATGTSDTAKPRQMTMS